MQPTQSSLGALASAGYLAGLLGLVALEPSAWFDKSPFQAPTHLVHAVLAVPLVLGYAIDKSFGHWRKQGVRWARVTAFLCLLGLVGLGLHFGAPSLELRWPTQPAGDAFFALMPWTSTWALAAEALIATGFVGAWLYRATIR